MRGAPTPELTLQGSAPSVVYIHMAARPHMRGAERVMCWSYTVQFWSSTGATRVLTDEKGVVEGDADSFREQEARLTALADAMRRVAAEATWAPPGSGTAVVVTSRCLVTLRLAAGVWHGDERSITALTRGGFGPPAAREVCRTMASAAQRAHAAFDALRQAGPVFMRTPPPGVWTDRATALTYRAAVRADGSGMPGLVQWQPVPAGNDDDRGEHGWGKCAICYDDFVDGMPRPGPQHGDGAVEGSPRPPGSFACLHYLCYECDAVRHDPGAVEWVNGVQRSIAGQLKVKVCPLCRAGRV